MKRLTKKENEIMDLFWTHGPMFIKELQEKYADPKPHVNTLSTMTRILEANGFVGHKVYGSTYQYYPLVTREAYHRGALSRLVSACFDNSYVNAVSALVSEEKITVEELKEIIARIEAGQNA
ncbi:MAG: BlaI/MecI/CopY family transcriptional regulator [Bacteroidales bacterium]|nr:BlaI/MecI/CopY family transcriptional regulator [Bacteroidales bacterium]